MSWKTVSDAKVVYVPLPKVNAKGEEKVTFVRLGIRVEMADGSYWFYTFRFKSWVNHYTGREVSGKGFNAEWVTVDRKDSYSENKLKREYANRPGLLKALAEGVEMALTAEAEKRAARR